MKNDGIKVNDLLKGKIDNLPEARSRMISIFLSSTFSGFYIEINA